MNFLKQRQKIYNLLSKKTLCIISIMFLLMVSIVISNNIASAILNTQQTELSLSFYGSARLLFIPAVGFAIDNIGDEVAENISSRFTIEGGFLGNINFDENYEIIDLDPGKGAIISYPYAIDGFGLVTVSIEVHCDNADPVNKSSKGFQIGTRTFIFG